MPCFYCGKRVSIVRQLTDADFCSDEHREKYHDLTRMALNRLMESHEQVSAPARRKGKGAVKEPPPSLAERLEAPAEPAPRKHAPRAAENVPPAPEKRPARPHRTPAPVIVTPPPPPVLPDPPVAGFAQFPVAEFSPESVPRGTTYRGFEVSEAALVLPAAHLAHVVGDFAAAAIPEPAGLFAETALPTRVTPSLRAEPTPKRRPRPVIPRAAAWTSAGLPEAELLPAAAPSPAGRARVSLWMTRQASPAAFDLELALPATRWTQPPQPDGRQDPRAANPARLVPPAAIPGRLDLRASGAAGFVSDAIRLPQRPDKRPAESRVLPGHAPIGRLPMPGAQVPSGPRSFVQPEALRFVSTTPSLPTMRESGNGNSKGISAAQNPILPGWPEAARGPSKPAAGVADMELAGPATPILPDVKAEVGHQIGSADFLPIGLPTPMAARIRRVAQGASGGISVPPVAIPDIVLGAPPTGTIAGVAPPVAVGFPRTRSAKPEPHLVDAMPCGSGANLLAPPAGSKLPAVFLPDLSTNSSRHAIPETAVIETRVSPAARSSTLELCEAPLATSQPMLTAGGVPVMLPRPVAFPGRLRGLASATAAPMPSVMGTAGHSTAARAEWMAYESEWRIPVGPKEAPAQRRLGAGTIEAPAAPLPKAPVQGTPQQAESAFAVPETVSPPAPAKPEPRPPGVMPPVARTPKVFEGTKPGPLGSAIVLPAPEPGLPAFEGRIPDAPGIGQCGPQAPGAGEARTLPAAPRELTVPIEIDEIQPPARPEAPARNLTVPAGGILPQPASSSRNVSPQPSAPLAAEFPTGSAAFGAQTPAQVPRHELAAGGSIPVATGRPRRGTSIPLPSGSAESIPQTAELPSTRPVARTLRLGAADHQTLRNVAAPGTSVRQTAGWEAMDRECGSAAFGSLGSKLPGVNWPTTSQRRFAVVKAPVPFGGKADALPPAAVEIPVLPVNKPAVKALRVSLGIALPFRRDVHIYADDRTVVRKAHLEPIFRKVRRPARLPVFVRARHGKASMPQAVFIPRDDYDDFEDFNTMRIAPGYCEPCPLRMVMPASRSRRDYRGELGTAGLLQPELAPVDRTVRAAAFGYRVPPIRPHLPDGWVDTVPVEFDPAAAEAAAQLSWEPLVGAIKNATKFFKFMSLGVLGLLVVSAISNPEDPRGAVAACQDSFGAGCTQSLQAGNQ